MQLVDFKTMKEMDTVISIDVFCVHFSFRVTTYGTLIALKAYTYVLLATSRSY